MDEKPTPDGEADAEMPDAEMPDAGLPDTGLPDAGLPDTGLPDAGLPDTGLPDAGLPDTGLPDAGLPDTVGDAIGEAEVGRALLKAVVAADRAISRATAVRTELVHDLAQHVGVGETVTERAGLPAWTERIATRRSLVMELAAALRMPERTAETLIEQSRMLRAELPETLAALRRGDLTPRHATVLAEEAVHVPRERRPEFEKVLVPAGTRLTAVRLRDRARRLRERLHPDSISERRREAEADRHIRIEPARDGMAWLSALLPAEQALAIDDRLTTIARGLHRSESGRDDEDRTIAQLRADALAHLLIDGETSCGTGKGVAAKVLVTVPVLTLLGSREHPGEIEGYGPIDPDTARRLAGHAPSFIRLLTNPETGAVLSVGRESYAVPADLRTWLRVRDETCRAIGCGRRAAHCDIDHTLDWQFAGETRHDNLAHLCRRHHSAKHRGHWRVAATGAGRLAWTSPFGYRYITEPSTVMRT